MNSYQIADLLKVSFVQVNNLIARLFPEQVPCGACYELSKGLAQAFLRQVQA